MTTENKAYELFSDALELLEGQIAHDDNGTGVANITFLEDGYDVQSVRVAVVMEDDYMGLDINGNPPAIFWNVFDNLITPEVIARHILTLE